jgi:hypothetical protein
MNWKLKVSFYCYLIASMVLITIGLIYLVQSEFMSYHAVAVGKNWSEVDPSFQILILALMKVTGGGFLASGFAIVIILFKAFKNKQPWAFWAIPVIGLITAISSLYATITVAQNTPASPPWIAAAVGLVLIASGFIFSISKYE